MMEHGVAKVRAETDRGHGGVAARQGAEEQTQQTQAESTSPMYST